MSLSRRAACSCLAFFFKTAMAGIGTHFKIFCYLMLPYFCAIAFVYVVSEKMQKGENTSVMWYHACICQFFWSWACCMHMRQINYFMGMCCTALSIPLTIFGAMMAINLDEYWMASNRLIVYAPAFLFCLLLFWVRASLPLVRSAKF